MGGWLFLLKMKKILLSIIFIGLCFILVSCLPENKADKAQEKMDKKSYNVIIDKSSVPSLIYAQTGYLPDFLMTASKENGENLEVIYAFSFRSKDAAEASVEYIKTWGNKKISGAEVKHDGKWVYFGTNKAVKDFEK